MTPTRILLAACCIVGSACSEPWHVQDGTTPINTTTPGDDCASSAAWTCQGISKCAASCGTNLDCVNTCKAKGCSGAQAAFTAVMTCTMKSCLSDCMSGFGAACDKCTAQACKAENDACTSNTCPGGGGGKCDSPSPSPSRQDGGTAPARADGGAAPEPTPSKTCATCNDINTCASKCGTDMSCVNACKATACTEAQTAFDAITSCVMSKCLMSCMGGFDDNCNKCASGSCKAELDGCAANTCPASCNGGSPTPTPSAASTCAQIVSCKQTSVFIDDCASKGCASAQQSFQALDTCVQASCGLSCFLSYGSPFCPGCITQSCAAAWQACQANHC